MRMIAEGRGGGLDLAGCLCRFRVAQQVLVEDILALLFHA